MESRAPRKIPPKPADSYAGCPESRYAAPALMDLGSLEDLTQGGFIGLYQDCIDLNTGVEGGARCTISP